MCYGVSKPKVLRVLKVKLVCFSICEIMLLLTSEIKRDFNTEVSLIFIIHKKRIENKRSGYKRCNNFWLWNFKDLIILVNSYSWDQFARLVTRVSCKIYFEIGNSTMNIAVDLSDSRA